MKKVPITVRLDEPDKALLKKIADANRRNITAQIVHWIQTDRALDESWECPGCHKRYTFADLRIPRGATVISAKCPCGYEFTAPRAAGGKESHE